MWAERKSFRVTRGLDSPCCVALWWRTGRRREHSATPRAEQLSLERAADPLLFLFFIISRVSAGFGEPWTPGEDRGAQDTWSPLGFRSCFTKTLCSRGAASTQWQTAGNVGTSCAMKSWRDITVVNNGRTHNNTQASKSTYSSLANCAMHCISLWTAYMFHITVPNLPYEHFDV